MAWEIFHYVAARHRIALLVEIPLVIVVIVFDILDIVLHKAPVCIYT